MPWWHMAIGALALNNGFCLLLINSNEEVTILSGKARPEDNMGKH